MATNGTMPYTSGSAVMTVIKRYRDKGLSLPITPDVLLRAGVSDSLVPRTIPALALLGLIDETGMPTATFLKLRSVPEAEFQSCLADWIKAAYAEVFQYVDPMEDDAKRVRDAFRTYVPHGQQDRMVSLFLALCAEAGLAPETKKSEPKTRKATTARASTAASAALRQAPKTNVAKPLAPRGHSDTGAFPPALAGLLQSIPSPSIGWTQAERDKFLAVFGSVLDYSIPIVAQRNMGDDEGEDE